MQKTLWKNCGSLFRSMSFLFSGTNNWVDQKEGVQIWKDFSFYICIRLERNANPIFGELFCLRVDLELSYRAHKRSAKVQDLIGFNVKSGVNWSKAGLWGKKKKRNLCESGKLGVTSSSPVLTDLVLPQNAASSFPSLPPPLPTLLCISWALSVLLSGARNSAWDR